MLVYVFLPIILATEESLGTYISTILKQLGDVKDDIKTMLESDSAVGKLRNMDNKMFKNAQKLHLCFQNSYKEYKNSSDSLKCYTKTMAYAIDQLNLIKQFVCEPGINDAVKLSPDVYDEIKNTIKDKKVLMEHHGEINVDEEKVIKFNESLLALLDRFLEVTTEIDHLCLRVLNDITVDVCILRSIISRHSCKACNTGVNNAKKTQAESK